MASQFVMGTLSPSRFRPLHNVYNGISGLRSLAPEEQLVRHKPTRTLLVTRSDAADTGAVVAEAASHTPSTKALLLFALPTLVLPLADPVMSLIDTICIGSYGTVVELAATGPASLLFASASQLFSAFSATALADISRALSKGDRVEASDAFAKAIRDAAIAGGFVLFLFGVFHLQLIQMLNVSPEVVPTAAKYLFIRAFAAPAATASAVLAASLLAQHDNRSPCIIVAASSVFSLICDVTLIVYFRMGLTGAAASTVVTQYLGLAALIHALEEAAGTEGAASSGDDGLDRPPSLDSFQGRPGGRARELLVSEASSATTDASDTQQERNQEQQQPAVSSTASEASLKAAGAGESGVMMTGSFVEGAQLRESVPEDSSDVEEHVVLAVDSADDSDDLTEYMTVGVASGEYLDPRFDSVPLEWDEQDDFDALRSVEADVALTLQAAAMPAGMGAMLPFGGSTDEEEEEPGVQLEGRMGWAGSSLSMDDTDTSLDANEAASTLEAASQSGNGDGGSAENGSGDNSSRSSSSDGATQVDEGSKVAAGSDKDQDALTTLTASTVSAAAATPAVKDAQEAKSMPGKADAAAEASSSIEATRDTASASLADVATGAAELDQLRSSTSAAASTGDGDESLQEEVVATGAGVENGNGAGEDCDWSGSSGTHQSRNISVTFARSAAVESSFSSGTEHSGKVEKEKKKSGGGGIALAAVYAAKLGCYFIVQGAAMRLSVVELAAHNAVFCIWNACAYFPVPLQTTALAYVPACSSFQALAKVTRVITVAAVALTVPLAVMCASVPLALPHLLTSDPKVAACMRSLAPIAAASILACTIDVACEGLLVAQGKLRQLLVTMCGVLTLVAAYFYTGRGLTLTGTWGGLLLFFGLRSMLSAAGVAWQMMSGRREALLEESEESSSAEGSEKEDEEGGSAEASSQRRPQMSPA